MEKLVNQQNFYLGCRACRQLLVKATSVFLFDSIPDLTVKYADAFLDCTEMEVTKSDGLPQRLCSDCAAKLTIAYQFKKDASESFVVLKDYSDMEKSENDLYEIAKPEDEDYFEYETIEELDESSQDAKHDPFADGASEDAGGNDAVSFLTGILKPSSKKKEKTVGIRKVTPKKTNDTGLNDPSRRHICNVCNKNFQKRSNLIDHLRLHANVKVFSCEYCEKSFVQAGNYKAHLRTHTKEKPYACHYCNKAYSQSSSLKIHIRTHTQEKNYICDICDKAFTNASDLGKHKLIHDDVKKYRCEECNRPFTQKIHLRKHLDKHHPEMDFEFALQVKPAQSSMKVETFDDQKIIVEEVYEVIEAVEDADSVK